MSSNCAVSILRICSQVSRPAELRRLRWRTTVSMTIFLLGVGAWTTSEAVTPGMYEISTEMLMPHLEDNLRYARTRERRCIRDHAVSDFFPILRHESLNGCTLAAGTESGAVIYYPLVCDGSNGTTGTAQLQGDAGRVAGELAIRMGGKNMTFSQRIEAKREGDCDSQR